MLCKHLLKWDCTSKYSQNNVFCGYNQRFWFLLFHGSSSYLKFSVGLKQPNVNSFQRDRFRLNFAAKLRLILHPGPSYYLILLAVGRPMVLRF